MIDLEFRSDPRISSDVFAAVLAARGSPAATDARILYTVPVSFGIDPAIALAFFDEESSYGLEGVAKATLNWGNLRKGQGRHTTHRTYGKRGTFAVYSSWIDSLHDWCTLIERFYIPRYPTVRKALPVYAPSTDNNNPTRYASTVIDLVLAWGRQSGLIHDWAAWGKRYPLPEGERHHAIPQAWHAAGDLGEAQSPEMHSGDGSHAARWFAGGVIVWERDGNRVTVVRG